MNKEDVGDSGGKDKKNPTGTRKQCSSVRCDSPVWYRRVGEMCTNYEFISTEEGILKQVREHGEETGDEHNMVQNGKISKNVDTVGNITHEKSLSYTKHNQKRGVVGCISDRPSSTSDL